METSTNIATHNQSNEQMLHANKQETDSSSSGTDCGAVSSEHPIINTNVAKPIIAVTTVTAKPTPFTDNAAMEKALAELGETCGQFKEYDSQLTIVEVVGTRIVKCLYQASTKTGKKVAENSYVRIPTKHLTEEFIISKIAELSPYVLTWLQSEEDKKIKEQHKKGLLAVHTEFLSLDNLIEQLEANEAGSRLNKEKIEAWFSSELEETLAMLFADKMNIADDAGEKELGKLELVLNAYKGKFASLASGKTFIKEEDCLAMVNVIKTCEAESTLIGSRFITRLEGMSKKEDEVLLSL